MINSSFEEIMQPRASVLHPAPCVLLGRGEQCYDQWLLRVALTSCGYMVRQESRPCGNWEC